MVPFQNVLCTGLNDLGYNTNLVSSLFDVGVPMNSKNDMCKAAPMMLKLIITECPSKPRINDKLLMNLCKQPKLIQQRLLSTRRYML
jgi:hypothetical protein